ncbi:hypothetical protein, partial [Paraburkholderia tropica]|uniref:hypothetical protein n=1 Tax=Paraburkholderia tropica TaxID=92647 RepID=UPI001CC7F22D
MLLIADRRLPFNRLALRMFNEPGRSDTAAQHCVNCAATFDAPLIFCPRCGANQLAAPAPATRDRRTQTLSSASLRAIGPIVPLPEQAAAPSFETSPTQLSPPLSPQLSPQLSPPLPTQLPAALARAPQAD